MNPNHQYHADYAKPEDQCISCEHEIVLAEQQVNADIDQAIEEQYHSHREKII